MNIKIYNSKETTKQFIYRKFENNNFIMGLKKKRIFPTINTLGYYDPFKFKIQLNEFITEDLKNIENLNYNKISTFVHEMQHWVDHSSTLWGFKYLKKIFESYHICLFPHETKLFNHRELGLFVSRNLFHEYYTETYNDVIGNFEKKWIFRLTAGFRFKHDGTVDPNRPIPFIRFYDNLDNPICRLPISVSSMLEATAIYAEFRYKISAILKLQTPYKEMQLERVNRDLESLLYNPKLVIYSGIVHLTSNFLKLIDPLDAYKCSAIFSKIVLNLPQAAIEKIKINKVDELAENASQKMLANGELGYVYYLLLKNYSTSYEDFNFSDFTTENILKASNLPNEQELIQEIELEIISMDSELLANQNSLNNMWLDYIFNGKINLKNFGISQFEKELINEIVYTHRTGPYLVCSDSEYELLDIDEICYKLTNNIPLTTVEWENFTEFCEERIFGFNEICGI